MADAQVEQPVTLAVAVPSSPRPALNSPLPSSPTLLSDKWQADFKKMLTIRRPDGYAPLLERRLPAVSQQVVPHACHDHDLCHAGLGTTPMPQQISDALYCLPPSSDDAVRVVRTQPHVIMVDKA